jgi:hypothetical protein
MRGFRRKVGSAGRRLRSWGFHTNQERAWRTVERTIWPADTPAPIEAPKIAERTERTERRWRARLASAARVLVVLFCASGNATLAGIGMTVGLLATRAELVNAHTHAGRVAPGARLPHGPHTRPRAT